MARTPTQKPQTKLPAVMQGLITPPAVAAPAAPIASFMVPTMPQGRGLSGALPSLASGTAMQRGFNPMPSYQMGGAIGPGGQPIRPAGLQQAAPQGQANPDMIEMQVQDFIQRNPQQVTQIQQLLADSLASGELTQQELNMVVQMATTALRNPALYPQLRQYLIQQNMADEEDLPPDFDQGLLITILIAGRALQANVGGQNMLAGGTPALAGQQPIQSMKNGGRVRGEPSEPVVIEAHTGEYVIPKHIVEMKGREFFDRMLKQYSDDAEDGDDDAYRANGSKAK